MKSFALVVIGSFILSGCSMFIGRTSDGGWCTPCIETRSSGFGLHWYAGTLKR